MKTKPAVILLLAALWGAGSWWWYTCKIKGFCSPNNNSLISSVSSPQANAWDESDEDKDGVRNGDEV